MIGINIDVIIIIRSGAIACFHTILSIHASNNHLIIMGIIIDIIIINDINGIIMIQRGARREPVLLH